MVNKEFSIHTLVAICLHSYLYSVVLRMETMKSAVDMQDRFLHLPLIPLMHTSSTI